MTIMVGCYGTIQMQHHLMLITCTCARPMLHLSGPFFFINFSHHDRKSSRYEYMHLFRLRGTCSCAPNDVYKCIDSSITYTVSYCCSTAATINRSFVMRCLGKFVERQACSTVRYRIDYVYQPENVI